MEAPTDWVEVGVVARAHGLTGELRVRLFNVSSEILSNCRRVRLAGELRRVRSARRHQDAMLLRVAGCDDRVTADSLRGALVEVARSDLPATEQDEYYFHDLVGLEAIGPAGVAIGRVVDVVETPGHANLVVADGPRRLEVPLAETFVGNVDLAGRTIRLERLEELPGWEEFQRGPC